MQGGWGLWVLMWALLASLQGQQSESLVALQAKDPAASVPACAERFQVHRADILAQFGIVLVSAPESKTEFSNAVSDCFKDGWDRLPVRESQSVYQIPTGEIMMKIKPGTDRGMLDQMLLALGLR